MGMNGEPNVDDVATLLQQTSVKAQNTVSIKGQGLKLNTAEDASEIIELIKNCANLEVLELVGNSIGVEAAKGIAKALENKPHMKRCLWADMFTGRLRSEIPPILTSLGNTLINCNTHLTEVDLSDNAFGPDGIKACVELLKSPAAYTIEELRFNNNGLGYGGVILAETLIECHKRSCVAGKPFSLKLFIAGRNRLENPGATALGKAFATIGTLEEIHIPQNGIQHKGITAFAQAVVHNPNLRHLNLNDNTFTDKGAIAMADAIKQINSLEVINFGDCLVRTAGAKAIGNSLLVSNPNLRELNLSFGEIRLEGALVVCEGISKKVSLEKVNLDGNQFGEDGVEEIQDIASSFVCSGTLESLSDDEGIDSDDEEEDDEDGDSEQDEDDEGNESYASVTNGEGPALEAANFLSDVNASNLLQMNEKVREELLDGFLDTVGDASKSADAFVRVAGLLTDECLESILTCSSARGQSLRSAVFQCTDAILSRGFESYPNTSMLVVNPILVHMGLIKSEDKKFVPLKDFRHVAVCLGYASKQDFFPKHIKQVIRSIVTKDQDKWKNCTALRSQFLQLLFS